MYLKKTQQKQDIIGKSFLQKEKPITSFFEFIRNFQVTKVDFSKPSLEISKNFFFLSIQLTQIFPLPSIYSWRLVYKKFKVNFLYKPKKYIINVSLNIYRKLHLYYLQSSFQKQQFNFFSSEFFLFKFLDLSMINKKDFFSTLQNNQKPYNLPLVSYYPEEKWSQKNKLFLDKPNIFVKSFFEYLFVNNYWLESFEKKYVKNLRTFTGENWFKHRFLLKKKVFSNLKFNTNNAKILNFTNHLNSFFKEKLTFNESFLPLSNLMFPSKKSVNNPIHLFLFEFHQKLYKLKTYSYINQTCELEKNFFNIHCLKLNFLFQEAPLFLSHILMHTLNSLDFLTKKKPFLTSVKETKLLFFSFKQFFTKYYCFNFNQRVSRGSPFIFLHFPCIKLVSNSYCQPFNSIDQSFLQFLKKRRFMFLSSFSLNFNNQASNYSNHLNWKSSENPFTVNQPKQKLKIMDNNTFVRFLKISKLITFDKILILRTAMNKQPFKKNHFEVYFSFQNSNQQKQIFELETLLFNLLKKLTYDCFYLKIHKELRNNGDKKSRLLNQWIALRKKEGFFLNLRKFVIPSLWNKSNSLFNAIFFSIENRQLFLFIKNSWKKLKYQQFLSIFNNWVLQNYPQLQPLRINKQKKGQSFQREILFNDINLKSSSKDVKNDPFFQKLPFYYSQSFIVLWSTRGSYIFLPNPLNISQYLNLLKKSIKFSATQTQELLMKNLNPKLYAWCYFYRFTNKNQMFYSLDTQLLKWLWRWACRRHNNKSKKWIKAKYFYTFNQKNWIFGTVILENSLNNCSQLTQANSLTLPLFSYFPFHSQIFWNLKKNVDLSITA